MRFDKVQIGDVVVFGGAQYGAAPDTLVLEKKSFTSAYVLDALTLERAAKHVFPMRGSAVVWRVVKDQSGLAALRAGVA
jgi:hypothetical protein